MRFDGRGWRVGEGSAGACSRRAAERSNTLGLGRLLTAPLPTQKHFALTSLRQQLSPRP